MSRSFYSLYFFTTCTRDVLSIQDPEGLEVYLPYIVPIHLESFSKFRPSCPSVSYLYVYGAWHFDPRIKPIESDVDHTLSGKIWAWQIYSVFNTHSLKCITLVYKMTVENLDKTRCFFLILSRFNYHTFRWKWSKNRNWRINELWQI